MNLTGIELDGVLYDLSPRAPRPNPDPVDPPRPSGTRQRMLWDYGWQALDPAALPPDVLPSLTHVSAFVAQSSTAGTGRLKSVPGLVKDRVMAYRAAAVRVDICVGGAKDGGITVTTPGQAAEMTASIRAMVSATGATGVDFDLEPSGGKWTESALLTSARALAGDGLDVHVTCALYGQWTVAWGAFVRALGPSLTSVRIMCYDFPEAGDDRLTKVTLDKLTTMRGYLAREDQLVVGFAPRRASGSQAAAVPSPVPVIEAAYRAARAKYPAAGWGIWHGGVDRSNGWTTVRALAKV